MESKQHRSQLASAQADGVANKPIRLAIIGCGYVTAMSHLPASQLVDKVQVAALVDSRIDLARQLAQEYNVSLCATDYREIVDQVDAVIVAVPHHLHAPIAIDLLNRGVHVLVEKPMATSIEECEQMMAAAQRSQAKLAVGLMRRFYDSNRLVKRFIETNLLGKVERFEAEEAVVFDNFKASPFTVLPPYGGVLLDTGPHMLDLLLWWLGDFTELHYWDDAADGYVEANCRMQVTTAMGAPGTIELSRTRYLENKIRLHCQYGLIEVSTHNPTQVVVNSLMFSGPVRASKIVDEKLIHYLPPFFAQQLDDFAMAISRNQELSVPGSEGMRCIAAIERCKHSKQPLETMPWMQLNEQILRRVDA